MPNPMPTPSAPAPPDSAAAVQRRTLVVLSIAQVIGTIGIGVAPSIGVLLAGQITENEAWAGLARSLSTLGAALVGLPLGSFAARHGRRWALAIGWWLASAGAVLVAVAAQWMLPIPLFAGLLLVGTGSAAGLQSRFAATDLADPRRRGRALGIVVWVGTLGSVLGPNLGIPGQVLGTATGLTLYAGAFLIAAACLALAGLIVFSFLRPDPLLLLNHTPDTRAVSATPPRRRFGRILAAVTEIRANQRAQTATLAILSAQVVMVAIMTMTPVQLNHHGGSIAIIGITISLHVVGMYALAPLVGIGTDSIGSRGIIGIGIGVLLVSLVISTMWPANTAAIMVALTLLGLGWSFVNVAASALFSAAVSDKARASAQGGVDALANLCGALAAFAAGPLLIATSFSVLSVLAMLLLVPLTVRIVLHAV
ncbi:MAG: MFS transporter [Propioniciclava sp.]